MSVIEKYCVSIEDVYGVPFAALSAPQGYEFTGEFRPALSGEWYRKVHSNTPQPANHDSGEPRLILRALPTVESVYGGQTLEQLKENDKTAKWHGDRNLKFEWTGEFRKVQPGDYFLSAKCGLDINLNDSGFFTGSYRLIMRKCHTIKEIYGKELSELTPPIGYRFTGEFRVPLHMEPCMRPEVHSEIVRYPNLAGDPHAKPRLILEKLPANPTIKDVYGTENPPIPKGWRVKEFRRIEDGEEVVWLADFGVGVICDGTKGNPFRHEGRRYDVNKWRIVLEEDVDLSTLTYTEILTVKDVYGYIPEVPSGYEVIDFRRPETGDVLLDTWGKVITADSDWSAPRLILSPLGPR